MFAQTGVAASAARSSHASTVKAAAQKVLGMIEAGKLPAPEQHYKIENISYDPRLYNAAGGVLAVDHVPTSAEQHAGRITVFPPAAGAMETAVLAVAHEMWRFNKAEGHIHDKAYQYAQGAQRVYNGGTYIGPTPVYEGGEVPEPHTRPEHAVTPGGTPNARPEHATTPEGIPNARPEHATTPEGIPNARPEHDVTPGGVPTPRPNNQPHPRPEPDLKTSDIPPVEFSSEEEDLPYIKEKTDISSSNPYVKDFQKRVEEDAKALEEREKRKAGEEVLIYLDELEALDQQLWEHLQVLIDKAAENPAQTVTHISAGTVSGSLESLLRLRNNKVDPAAFQRELRIELDSYRAQVLNHNFDPRDIKPELQNKFDEAMRLAVADGSHIDAALQKLHGKYGNAFDEIRQNVAKEVYPPEKFYNWRVFQDLPPEMQSRVEREILARMEKDIGTLNISVKAGGLVNSGFAIVTAALAVKSAKEAENFYGELSRQIFNITAGELVLRWAAKKGLPKILMRLGIPATLSGPPLPQKIAFGVLMIAGSFLIGWAIDEATDKSGVFDDLFREGGGNNHVKRRREERQKQYQK